MLLSRLEKSAFEKCKITRDQLLVVGVSGGADSLVLLHGLHTLGFSLMIGHLDHGIRPESASDADYVESLANHLNIPFVCHQVDVPKLSENSGLSLEEAARNARYEFLFKLAEQEGAQALATAHHADDQVETVLMHYIRGAALDGLSGMLYRRILPQWSEIVPLVRPLLGIWREEIDCFIEKTGLTPRIDRTNLDTTYFRNWLRHQLIPQIEISNPQFRRVVWRAADVLGEENKYLDSLAELAWSDCFIEETDSYVSLKREEFNSQPKALQRRILRKAISFLRPGLRDLGFESIEHGIEEIARTNIRGEIDLAARLNLVIFSDIVIVKTWESKLPDFDEPLLPSSDLIIEINLGEKIDLENTWFLKTELLEIDAQQVNEQLKALPESVAWVDFDALSWPLILRGRKPGENWRPLGMSGHSQTLQDFFINRKTPFHIRDRWPLVVSGDDIVWLAGIRPAEPFKVTHNTTKILQLTIGQIKSTN